MRAYVFNFISIGNSASTCALCTTSDSETLYHVQAENIPVSMFVDALLNDDFKLHHVHFWFGQHDDYDEVSCTYTGECFTPEFLFDLCEECFEKHFPKLPEKP